MKHLQTFSMKAPTKKSNLQKLNQKSLSSSVLKVSGSLKASAFGF